MERVRPKEAVAEAKNIPAVYRLIEGEAPSEEIMRQVFEDYYTHRDMEKVYLGLEELISRGADGRDVLEKYSSDTSGLGEKIIEILKFDRREALSRLVEILGVFKKNFLKTGEYKEIFDYLAGKGYLEGAGVKTPEDLQRSVMSRAGRPYSSYMETPQVRGVVEDEIITNSFTFGTDEPAYLELLGPREILRMRSAEKPNFLLLGSLGKYSAREFTSYTKKLNPEAGSFVIDCDKSQKGIYTQLQGREGVNFALANALSLPFADESFDHVYTNSLLHLLKGEKMRDVGKQRLDNIVRLFSEVKRVLKRGGSLVMAEKKFMNAEDQDFFSILSGDADDVGLKLKTFQGSPDMGLVGLEFVARKDVDNGGAGIDKNGFPDYGGKMLVALPVLFNVRFVK